jgi:putative peptidoglycan lipid II flippase
MTTPGRRAGPTADDDGLDPDTGGLPGNGTPAGDAGYGVAPDRAAPGSGLRDGGYGQPRDPTRPLRGSRDDGYDPSGGPTLPGAGPLDAGYDPYQGPTLTGARPPDASHDPYQGPTLPGARPPNTSHDPYEGPTLTGGETPDAGYGSRRDQGRPRAAPRAGGYDQPPDRTRPGPAARGDGYGLPPDRTRPGPAARGDGYGPPPDPGRPRTGNREAGRAPPPDPQAGYGLPTDRTRPQAPGREADYAPPAGPARPGPRTRPGSGTGTRPGSGTGTWPRPGTRQAGAGQPRGTDRTRPRHPVEVAREELRTAAEINARIARTIENARSARSAAAARPGPGPGAVGYAPARPARPPGQGRTGQGRVTGAPATGGSSLLRSSSAMAVGTIASRVTGFVRSAILIYAIGTHDLGNAYNVANTLPNIVYNLALGGILTSVVVPLLVKAARRDRDRGEAYDQRIFTLGVLALGAITVVGTAAALPITSVYAGNIGNAATYHLTVIFAYFFIPQIFFYGVSSLAGAVLNARGSFAAPMWTPVINNVVVILVGLAFIATAGLNRTPASISGAEVQLLGLGTTIGIVAQTVALIPSLRRVGFRWRPRYDFRRSEVSEIGRMSGWMFGYVIATQIAFLVTTRVANSAGARVPQQAAGAGFAAYSNAYMLFQLPYAIVGVSVITAMLPRMSAHASEGKYRLVSSDFSSATRLASVIVVPASLILAVLGGPLAEGVFGYGSTSAASARYLGEIFAVFSLGLLPFMLFQLLLRVFYAMHDSRTPAFIGLITMTVNIVANLIALAILPPQHVVAGLGAGFGVASLTGTVVAWRVLGRRIGGLDGDRIRVSLVRMHAAAIPAAIFAIAVSVMVDSVISGGRFAALLTVAIGGSGAMFLYLMFAKAFDVRELTDVTATIRARLR